ncbi:hypothetical protein CFD26_104210 [Aspergillus turcosus]|uniref:Major facilitator superfamily (MFS) profile domain-containing protein n=1 Tax=Aspergillus turcosus TaxID=1245748 RepID=A0A3R7JE85_9EURO|nr:hypothetical protein CFD26_104210 [Aspergillus turcosus]
MGRLLGGILAMPQFLAYFNYPGNFQQGGITASIQAGAFAGSILTGAFLADRLGRKKTILLGSALFTIGCAIACAANGLPALVAGRLINGLGNGCLAMMVPLYQSEIAPREIRGRIISMQQCFINLGILIAFWIQYATSFLQGSAAWRIPLGLQMVATVALHITMYFLPESPRWLIANDRQDEAGKVLAKLHANGNISDLYVQAELTEIVAKIKMEKENPTPTYISLLFGNNARRMWIGIGVQFWQQVTGINVIMYYAVFLFQQAGIGGTQASLLANGIQGVVLNVITWINMWYIDSWGRRRPMIIGALGMAVSMMLIGVIMKTMGHPVYDTMTHKTNFHFAQPSASHAAIAFVYIYVFWFALTWACVAWVYPTEVFAMNMRGKGTSITSATNWFVNFWFALYIPTAMAKISWELYLIFMAICVVSAITVYLYFPVSLSLTCPRSSSELTTITLGVQESAGKTLEEMDFLFTPGRSPWVFKDKEATKVGALFDRDMLHGEALTSFDPNPISEKTVVQVVRTGEHEA